MTQNKKVTEFLTSFCRHFSFELPHPGVDPRQNKEFKCQEQIQPHVVIGKMVPSNSVTRWPDIFFNFGRFLS